MKVCALCKESKPAAEYYPNRGTGGLQSRCIACHKKRKRCKHETSARERAERGFVARFWSYVDKRGADECWEWTGYRHRFGYGLISRVGKHAMLTTHRVSWELHNGSPGGLHVLHRCDNPPCVNPAHLFLGTHAENMRDMSEKGRCSPNPRRGEDNNKSKLTTAQVLEIRRRYAAGGVSIRQLARELGVTFAPVQRIISGKGWKHV